MSAIILRPADPERDFAQLADWFTLLEGETSTESSLKDYYTSHQSRITQQLAVDEQDNRLGFSWATRNRFNPELASIFLFVQPELRGQGIGRRLYEELLQAVTAQSFHRLRISIWDNCPEGRAFAERRGFEERAYEMTMALNLDTFDDRPYADLIARLQNEGFQFTSMEALGDTEEAQRRLYQLNETANMETPGTDGSPAWTSFEDFQQNVCKAEWYRPASQMVVIDTATDTWVAMSAITRFDDYAYNLFTGVDKRYRGRKLAQAVKILALRYAREVLDVHTVRTHHNGKNLPMIAIDRKFGYIQQPGLFVMEKQL